MSNKINCLTLFIFLMLGFISPALAQNPFITTWKTDNPGVSNSTSIIIPVQPGRSDYNYDVDWNDDGVYEETAVTGSVTHDFGAAGTYTIRIRGNFPQMFHYYTVDHDAEKLLEINQWGDIEWKSMGHAFAGCKNMVLTATDAPDLSQVTDLGFMFDGCVKFNTNIDDWNVSTITDFEFVFRNCKTFNQPLNDWQVANAIQFAHMFGGCSVFNQPLDHWNVSKAESFSAMFTDCTVFNQDITGWNVGNATHFDQMFSGTGNFNQDISGWNVSNGTSFTAMFAYSTAFSQDISNWNMSNAKELNSMFLASQAFNHSLIKWDVSHVETMAYMFSQSIFNEDISTWDTKNVIDMTHMFWNNTVFDQPIGDWNTSSDTTMQEMFRGARSFNQDISGWDVSNVTNMSGMFLDADGFNQDIGTWDVGHVKNFSGMFSLTATFNQDIGSWNTSSATDMSAMFNQSKAFDQDISDWDVRKVTDMTAMFRKVTLSTGNYDNLLIGWGQLALKHDVPFDGGFSKYCQGAAARQSMIDTFNWTITDGGTADAAAPLVVCKDITVALNATGNATITADMLDGGSTDDCSSVADLTFSASQTTFTCSDIGDVVVPLTVTDLAGKSASCDAKVTVAPPPLTLSGCPADITIPATEANCMATATWTLPVTSCGNTLTATHNSGDQFPLGTTEVTYTATDGSGNMLTCSFNVTVETDLAISASTQAPQCPDGDDGQIFLSVAQGVSPYSFDWNMDGIGDFDDVQNPSGLPADTYDAVVRDAQGCEKSIEVALNGPDPIQLSNEVAHTENTSILNLTVSGGTAPYAYTWIFDHSESLGNSEDIALNQAGEYEVTVTDAHACENTLTTSIEGDQLNCDDADFVLYPNPSDGKFNLRLNDCANKARVEVYTMQGKLIFSGSTSKLHNELDLTRVAKGQYILRVTMGHQRKAMPLSIVK